MAYQALYRVYRPQTFSGVVGQDVITKTLRNAVANEMTSHAYLFCGPRGTGKTSCAKILAKAINCENPQDGEPCNECEICNLANENKLNDIIEIDAASNNGVEEIRDIRDKVKYVPTQAKNKVYIIDEVHMLSTGAFNALLKTLEEPPEHVMFILATTEPQKIPATIISRTQRFDFKRIDDSVIEKRLQDVLEKQNIEYDTDALKVITAAAEGGMRDALSIMDQAISYGDNKLSLENSLQVTGFLSNNQLLDYFGDIVTGDTSKALADLADILADGRSPMRLTESIITLCRDLILIKSGNEDSISNIVDANHLKSLADKVSKNALFKIVDIVSETQNNIKNSNQTDIYLEIMTIKAADAVTEPEVTSSDDSGASNAEVQKLSKEVKELKAQLKNTEKVTANVATEVASETIPPKKSSAKRSQSTNKVDKQKIFEVLANATKQDLDAIKNVWKELNDNLNSMQQAMLNVANPVAAGPNDLIIAFDYQIWLDKANNDTEFVTAIEDSLSNLLDKDIKITFIFKDDWLAVRNEYIKKVKSGNAKDSKSDEPKTDSVTTAQDIFGKDNINIKND